MPASVQHISKAHKERVRIKIPKVAYAKPKLFYSALFIQSRLFLLLFLWITGLQQHCTEAHLFLCAAVLST